MLEIYSVHSFFILLKEMNLPEGSPVEVNLFREEGIFTPLCCVSISVCVYKYIRIFPLFSLFIWGSTLKYLVKLEIFLFH